MFKGLSAIIRTILSLCLVLGMISCAQDSASPKNSKPRKAGDSSGAQESPDATPDNSSATIPENQNPPPVTFKPVEEDEILGEGEEHRAEEGFFDRMFVSKQEKLEIESQKYAFDYKRFKQWMLRVEPWVRPDGSITYPSEQIKIMQSN